MIKRELSPLDGELKTRDIAVFDIEARNKTDVVLIGYLDENGYRYFQDVSSFLQFIEDNIILKRKTNKWLFAHYGGRYDFLALIEDMLKRGYQLVPVLSSSRIIAIKIKRGKYKFTIVDSFNLLPMSLKKIGSAFGTEKLEFNFDTDFDNWNKLLEYNKRDCEALYNALNQFQNIINQLGGNMKTTLASTSLDLFRRKYLNLTIPDNSEYSNIIRLAYYGGRCEVFKKMGAPCYYFDFNSLYPSVMIDNYMPVGKAHYYAIKSIRPFDNIPVAFVYADIISPEPENLYFPVLPYKYKNKLIFPTGKFSGWWDIELLRVAEKEGYIIKPQYIILFDKYEKIFKDFITDLYNLRLQAKKENNEPLSLVVKLLMNSLYGKFGQREEQEIIVVNPDTNEIINDKLKPITNITPDNIVELEFEIFSKKIISRAVHIHPEISAHITALAQIKLYNAIKQATENNINIYYTDTDSLFVNSYLEDSKELGRLKLEAIYDKVYFVYPKNYFIPNKLIKMKGFRTEENKYILTTENGIEKAIEITEDLILKLLNKETTIQATYQDVLAFKSSAKKGKFFITGETTKQIRHDNLEKRYFFGYDSLPWVVKDGCLLAPDEKSIRKYLSLSA